MRLLNVATLEFTEFYTQIGNVPEYVIASHRWLHIHGQPAEASYRDVKTRKNRGSPGYKKVEEFAAFVRRHVPHVRWLWIDTCCINKSDSQETNEAINSMFKWYAHAALCIAHLADVERVGDGDLDGFKRSQWFTRGWTLQELLAPRVVVFVTQNWRVIGHKGNVDPERFGPALRLGSALEGVIARRTGIPPGVLHDYRSSRGASREEKLRWMEGRTTTKEEDSIYCMFGILDVAIGANYGEGREKAERRLRQQLESEDSPYEARAFQGNGAPPSSTVPFRRDQDYVERGTIMDNMSRTLSVPGSQIALVGLGGVGKSQLAIEFAYRYRHKFPWVIWVNASNAARFEQSIRDFMRLAKIPEIDDFQKALFQDFRAWLWDRRNGRWLVVLDSADDTDFLLGKGSRNQLPGLRGFDTFPTCDHGSIIITSRNLIAAQSLVDDDDIISVPPMELETAVALLDRKLGQTRRDSAAGHSLSDYRELAVALGCMPLAITQAVAFLRRKGRSHSIRDYLEALFRINNVQGSLLDADLVDLRRDGDATNSIFLTWQISLEHLSQKRQTAAGMLSLMSLCNCESIPDILVKDGAETQRVFEEDVELLRGYSFISDIGEHGARFQMHRLMQVATRRWMSARGELQLYVERLVLKLDQLFPRDQHSNWPRCELLYPHDGLQLHSNQRMDGAQSGGQESCSKGPVTRMLKAGRCFGTRPYSWES